MPILAAHLIGRRRYSSRIKPVRKTLCNFIAWTRSQSGNNTLTTLRVQWTKVARKELLQYRFRYFMNYGLSLLYAIRSPKRFADCSASVSQSILYDVTLADDVCFTTERAGTARRGHVSQAGLAEFGEKIIKAFSKK